MKEIKLRFISDPGHGWLEVPVNLYKESGIVATRYSYYSKRKECVYLEEDLDANKFIEAMKKKNVEVKFEELHQDPCFVRDLGPMPGI